MVVLCALADAQSHRSKRDDDESDFHVQTMVCFDLRSFSRMGKHAFSRPARAAKSLWLVHAVSACLVLRESALYDQYSADPAPDLHVAGVGQCVCGSLFLSTKEKNAFRGGGH